MDIEPPSLLISTTSSTFDVVGILLLILLCLTVIFFISCAEKIFFSLNNKDLNEENEKEQFKSQSIIKLLEKPKKLLITFNLLNYVLKISSAYLIFGLLFTLLNTYLITSAIIVLGITITTVLLLFSGEIIPRIYYSDTNKLQSAKRYVIPVLFLEKLLSPISLPIRAIVIYLQEIKQKKATQLALDNNSSQTIANLNSDDEILDEQKILDGIISFGNTEANQIMTPRIDIFAIEISENFEEILPKIIDKGFSRIPVYKENIDEIVGILFIKDIISEFSNTNFNWNSVIRKPFFVPENKKLESLLKDFQNLKNHLAIVVDEYGGTSGLLTLEDVIEEIVGDISDEFDDDELNFTKIDDRNYIFEGKINLIDFYKIIEVDESSFENKSGEAETLAGLILEVLESFPTKGQKIEFENCLFSIEAVDKKRIKLVKVTIK